MLARRNCKRDTTERIGPPPEWASSAACPEWIRPFAGLQPAQFRRRVKGYKQMPQLVTALRRQAHPATARSTETVSAAA